MLSIERDIRGMFGFVWFSVFHSNFYICIVYYIVIGYKYLVVRAIQEATTDPLVSKKSQNNESDTSSSNWKVKMLYDGDCPLCMREVCLYPFLVFNLVPV